MLCAATLAGSSPAHATTQRAIDAARHHRAVTWQADTLGAYPLQTLPRAPGPPLEGWWWRRAYAWYHASQAARQRLDGLRHGSQAACYAFVQRRFGHLSAYDAGIVTRIVSRESGCHWYADNPTSTAAGPMQFLDSWGSYAQRTDIVWSINRAYAYRVATGWYSPWSPVPA